MNFTALIPARHGSKGLPGKNTRMVAGKPMVEHTMLAAKNCPAVDSIWLTTDDNECAYIAKKHGLGLHMRPDHLGSATATMLDVVCEFAEVNKPLGAIVLLYPTYPTRSAADIDEYIRIFQAYDHRPLIGVTEALTHPYKTVRLEPGGRPVLLAPHDQDEFYQRQKLPKAFEVSHCCCVFKVEDIPRLNAVLMCEDMRAHKIRRQPDVDSLHDAEIAHVMLASSQGVAL